MKRKKLFISYSHKDARWFDRVREQLAVLEREGLIDPFDDTRVGAGEDWLARLDREMLEARIAVLLISAPFLTSAFIQREEIPRLFDRHEDAGMALYPLLVRDCPWQEVSWLARLQIRPRDARPIASLRGAALDKCLANVAREIATMARAPARDTPGNGTVSASQPDTSTVSRLRRPLSENEKLVLNVMRGKPDVRWSADVIVVSLHERRSIVAPPASAIQEAIRGLLESGYLVVDSSNAFAVTGRAIEFYRTNPPLRSSTGS